MRDQLREIIEYIKRKEIDYADGRYVESKTESITIKDGRLENLARNEGRGVGIRVLHNGCWGFASGSLIGSRDLKRLADKAIGIARASAVTRKAPATLAPVEPFQDAYFSPAEINPFTVPLDEKIDLLMRVDQALHRQPKVKVTESSMDFYRTEKIFCSTEDALIEQTIIESGAGYEATAVENGEAQKRSYPNSHRGDFRCAGYEFIKWLDLPGNAERVADEAAALLSAPPCPVTKADVVITGDQMALQVHESCGHPVELDRVLGTEISLAGGSFMTTDKLGNLKYGSNIVNIVQDATIPYALGSFGYDDEGVKASRTDIIRNGLFVGYLTSRETAKIVNAPPNGAMRADGWHSIPLIRMTNINLEPGNAGLDDLIADTKDGILLSTNKSWSIDDKRLNFQFGVEIAWQIKDGKITTMYKNPVYTGITPEFWNSCDAICSRDHWRIWGLPSCGKGEPMQSAHVAHGTSPARFRDIQVGVSR
ncbi:MAG: peptidase C69 [candidate division Zixibacteria bacterium RBG_16_53_22]|nr:MAG: peptidase C69 [candidate division Zixibacteria bacterium RBG_16_53_22]